MNLDAVSPDREIVTTRLIDAPRALVFEAWTDVKHLAHWYGPDGFTITTTQMEFKTGGKWLFTMHGPDGREYPNWVQYRTIVPNERIECEHGGEAGKEIFFYQVITFADEAGKTRITMRGIFPTAEDREYVAVNYGAVEGGQQTIARLAAYVESLK